MKTAWTTLAILAGLGVLCCGGVFFVAWRSLQISLRANRGAENWANAHFPALAKHWDPEAWIELDEPDKEPGAPEIRTRAASYLEHFGDLVKIEPFVATGTYLTTTGRGLEFTVTLYAKAEFTKGPATVTLRAHHAMSTWTIQNLEIKARVDKTSNTSLNNRSPNCSFAFVS
jgi:hypothetical protein